MSDRTGLGPLELAVLQAVGDRRRRRRTTAVLQELEERAGIAPAYGLHVIGDLLAPWRRHLLLLDGVGNWGTVGDDPPADPRYTEVGLSAVGRLALRAEAGEVGPVPLGLVDGTLYAGGAVPPFDPGRVLAALRDGSDDAGPPALPTEGEVGGEVDELLAGRPARLQLGPRIAREQEALVITGLPLGVSLDQLVRCLHSKVRTARHEPAAVAPVPVVDVWDETDMRVGTRVVCRLAPDADPAVAERWVRGVWPVTVEVSCRLPASQRDRLHGWDRGDGSGLAELAALLG